MKKTTAIIAWAFMLVLLASCGGASEGPLTEAQQAEQYGMSVAEFKEQKDAAARMNMTIEDHLKMSDTSDGMDHSGMDMSDDSSMIEDDSEMPVKSSHTMEGGTVMKDNEMHMEMMHEWDDIEGHGSDTHGDHK